MAAQSGTAAPSAEPSGDILDALQALAAENQKLRVELDRVKTENASLRQENKELRAGASKRDDWFSFSILSGGKKKPEKTSAVPSSPTRQGSEGADGDALGFSM